MTTETQRMLRKLGIEEGADYEFGAPEMDAIIEALRFRSRSFNESLGELRGLNAHMSTSPLHNFWIKTAQRQDLLSRLADVMDIALVVKAHGIGE